VPFCKRVAAHSAAVASTLQHTQLTPGFCPNTLSVSYTHLLQMTPGSIKFLTEQPMFFITGIWSSSLVKLLHYSKVLLGRQPWKGRGESLKS
jgi:hypothetical protein